jgi:branched-chain amino acid transport system permease protein
LSPSVGQENKVDGVPMTRARVLRRPPWWAAAAAGALLLPLGGWRPAVAAALITGFALGVWSLGGRHPRVIRGVTASLKSLATLLPARARFSNRGVQSVAIVVLLAAPLALNNYVLDVLTLAWLYVVLALGLQTTVGLAGLLDLGYASFYALGAYSYAIASTKLGVSFWVGLPLGALAAAACGLLLGVITLRLRGDYLAIVTLGFIQIVHIVLVNWDSVTNGPNGILNVGRPQIGPVALTSPSQFYYVTLGVALLAIVVNTRLRASRIGRALMAIRDDELAAESVGVPTTRLKVLAFALGASWAGVAGVCFAARYAFVSPESFTFFESVVILAMVVLGGMSSVMGVAAGAVIIVVLPELLRGVDDFRMLAFGAALVAMMAWRPEGLARRAPIGRARGA